jgi:hypothetical protein
MSSLPRRLLLTALVLAALACVGCAADPYGWREKPDHPALPAVFVTVDREALNASCNLLVANLRACARRDFARGVCFVYITSDAQPWLRTHELAHCAGWSHQ